MRLFNTAPQNRAAGRSIGFTGFDMQTPEIAAETVRDFVELNDADILPEVDEAIGTIRKRNPFGYANSILPLERVRGRQIKISGWIKTEALEGGWAGFWCRADSAKKTGVAIENMQSVGPSVIGFSIGKGQYRAKGLQDQTQWTHELSAPAPGSFEEVFLDTEIPIFILDLRASRTAEPDSPAAWFNADRPHRMYWCRRHG